MEFGAEYLSERVESFGGRSKWFDWCTMDTYGVVTCGLNQIVD